METAGRGEGVGAFPFDACLIRCWTLLGIYPFPFRHYNHERDKSDKEFKNLTGGIVFVVCLAFAPSPLAMLGGSNGDENRANSKCFLESGKRRR